MDIDYSANDIEKSSPSTPPLRRLRPLDLCALGAIAS